MSELRIPHNCPVNRGTSRTSDECRESRAREGAVVPRREYSGGLLRLSTAIGGPPGHLGRGGPPSSSRPPSARPNPSKVACIVAAPAFFGEESACHTRSLPLRPGRARARAFSPPNGPNGGVGHDPLDITAPALSPIGFDVLRARTGKPYLEQRAPSGPASTRTRAPCRSATDFSELTPQPRTFFPTRGQTPTACPATPAPC
jgi:hypothetical protein